MSSSSSSVLASCLERVAPVALELSHAIGWRQAHELIQASRGLRAAVGVVLPLARRLLRRGLLLVCRDSRICLLELDRPAERRLWVASGSRERWPNSRAVVALDGDVVSVTDKGQLFRLVREREGWSWKAYGRGIPNFGLGTRVLGSDSGQSLYLLDGERGGRTSVREVCPHSGEVLRQWRGLGGRRGHLDLPAAFPLLVGPHLCWFALDDTAGSLATHCLDPRTGRLMSARALRHPRIGRTFCSQLELIAVAGCVYALAYVDLDAVGGDPKRDAVSSALLAWRLDLSKGKRPSWEALPPVPTARFGFGAAALGGRLFVVGGDDPVAPGVLDVVEVFDPATGEWSRFPPLPTARSCPLLVSHEGLLFALGGCGDIYDCSTESDPKWPSRVVEVFDPAENCWNGLPSIPEKLASPSSCHLPPMVLAL